MAVKGRQDTVLIGSLLVLGFGLMAAAWFSAGLFKDRVLASEATAILERWQGHARAAFGVAAGGDEQSARLFALRDTARADNLSNYAIYGTDGALLAREVMEQADGLRGAADRPATDPAEVRRAAAGETIAAPDAHEDSYRMRLVAPVTAEGRIAGAVEIVVDLSSTARVLDVSLGLFAASTAFLVWIAFFIPVVVAWFRIKERMKAESRIHHLAHHDALTGLPNRLLFHDRLQRALVRAQRTGSRVAVLFIDLDRFKEVNDTLGHGIGDGLLKSVAERLEETVRDLDTVGRLGGDEFAVIAEDVRSPDNVIQLADRIVEALGRTHVVDGQEVVSAGSIGIAMTPEDGLDPDVLMRNADTALYRAKNEGRGTFRFFEPHMDAELQQRRDLEHDLRQAVREGAFELHYQPQHDLKAGAVTGYEALLRWHHATRGTVPPAVFVPVAEETGLIVPLGEWVLRRACADAVAWPAAMKVAVNFSPVQFRKSDVASLIERVLTETRFPPERLEIEITEGVLLQNTEATLAQLKRIRAHGVTIAMDDFGTGYASLAYLARFPFDKIKIDKSFIAMLNRDPNVAAIVSSIIGLGATLSMTITAEGVETQAQAEALRVAGCETGQGFLFGRPEPIAAQEVTRRVA